MVSTDTLVEVFQLRNAPVQVRIERVEEDGERQRTMSAHPEITRIRQWDGPRDGRRPSIGNDVGGGPSCGDPMARGVRADPAVGWQGGGNA